MNLIITCARHLEQETKEELLNILEEFGDPDANIVISDMSGIMTASTKLEPIEVVRRIKEMILDEPWSIRYCLRIIPIQKVIETTIENIEKIIENMNEQIKSGETYRISIEKRKKHFQYKKNSI